MISNKDAIKALELCRNSRTVIPTNETLAYVIDELYKTDHYKKVLNYLITKHTRQIISLLGEGFIGDLEIVLTECGISSDILYK